VDVIILLSFLFLLSPVIGYVVIALNISLRAKITIAAAAAAFMIITPVIVMLVFGGGYVGSG
jgi:hypothetical protein